MNRAGRAPLGYAVLVYCNYDYVGWGGAYGKVSMISERYVMPPRAERTLVRVGSMTRLAAI